MGSLVEDYLAAVHSAHLDDRGGAVADNIPEMGEVDHDAFGICIATGDGHLYEVGDTRTEFTIQSIAKPFTYGLALADRGHATVAGKIDVEPSGDAFNEISLDPVTGRPRNPMINAGAIAAASLVAGDTPEERYDRLRGMFSNWAGRDLSLNERIFAADLAAAHRHRAIGHLLRGSGVIEDDPQHAVDLYFRQCSLNVDCRDLALMAATLANGGLNPRTGTRALDSELVERVMSVMTTCGMYDGAGTWVADVGLPAKSGIGGGVLAVLPGQIGIAVFSPRLDEHGNSVRGVNACRQISRELELHFLHVTRARQTAIRAAHDVLATPSSRRRTPAEQAILGEYGQRARVFALHGDLLFAGVESVLREVADAAPELDAIVLDVTRVGEIADVARGMLRDAAARLAEADCAIALVDPDGDLPRAAQAGTPVFADLDDAVAWAEDHLIARHGGDVAHADRAGFERHGLIDDLGASEREVLREVLEQRHVGAGELIVASGAPPAGVFLVVSGEASACVADGNGGMRRVAQLTPGTSFGKRATLAGDPHATDVAADSDVELLVLTPEGLIELEQRAPRVVVRLLRTMFAQAHATAVRGTAQ